MSGVRVILAREYLQRVRTKGFIFSTIAFPVIMAAFIVIPIMLESRDAASGTRIALLDRTGTLAGDLTTRLDDAGFEVEILGTAEEDLTEARSRVADGTLGGILEVGPETLARGSATYTAEEAPSPFRRLQMRQFVSQSALEAALGSVAGAEAVRELVSGGSLEVVSLDESGPTDDERTAGIIAGAVGAFLLYMVLLIYGTMVLRAVLEEKTSRIVEIIVSSVRPWELMLGKVLGVGSVGLTQLAIWAGFAAIFLVLGASSAIPFLAGSDILPTVIEALPPAWVFVFFFACFLLGFFMYASLFAAVGAMCSTEEEAQQMQFPVVMLVVIPIAFLMPALDNPDATFAVVASLVPFFSPILMFARVAAGAAGPLEAGLSIVLMGATLFACAWVAGRIYRVGILMQGKRPTLPEIIRWVREA